MTKDELLEYLIQNTEMIQEDKKEELLNYLKEIIEKATMYDVISW